MKGLVAMDSTPQDEHSKPTYWIQIPAEIYTDTNIPHGAKILYGLYKSMSKKIGVAWPSNRYLAEILSVSDDTISRWTSLLLKGDHITVKLQPRSNNKTKRLISPSPASTHDLMSSGNEGGIGKNADTPPAKMPTPSPQKSGGGIGKNPEHIDTSDKEKDKGLLLSLSDFLDPSTKKGLIYLSAKEGYKIGGDAFFDWFESEVLNRFSRFTGCILNKTILKDWDLMVFLEYHADISTAAACEMLTKTKGTLPGPADVALIARKMRSKQIKKKEADDLIKRNLELKAEMKDGPQYPFMKMEPAELMEYYASEKKFTQILIERHRPEIIELLQKKSGAQNDNCY